MNEHHSAESQHRSDGKSARPLWRRVLVASLVTTSLVIPGAMTFAAYQQVGPQQSPFVLFLPAIYQEGTPQPSPTTPTSTTTVPTSPTTTATTTTTTTVPTSPTSTTTTATTTTTVPTSPTSTTATTTTATTTTATTTTATTTTATSTTETATSTTETATSTTETATSTTETATSTTETPTSTTETPTVTSTTETPTVTSTTETPTVTSTTETPTVTPTTPTVTPSTCANISTLTCAAVPVTLPYSLSWDADEGGLDDANGVGTGFTMADPPSAPLAATTTPTPDPSVPGYDPSRLTVDTQDTGSLTIVSTKGIQFRDPLPAPGANLAGTNSQVNALGVGFPASGTFRVSTTLVNPNFASSAGNNSQQAGLWFGLNENNYVKLVVVKSAGGAQVQLAVERYGDSPTGPVPVSLNTADIAAPETKTFTLIMEVNSVTNTVRGFYQVDGGAETQVIVGNANSVSILPSFVTGSDHDANPATPAISYAGIFTTHRNAAATASIAFEFDSFSIAPVLPPPPPPVNGQAGTRMEAVIRREIF